MGLSLIYSRIQWHHNIKLDSHVPTTRDITRSVEVAHFSSPLATIPLKFKQRHSQNFNLVGADTNVVMTSSRCNELDWLLCLWFCYVYYSCIDIVLVKMLTEIIY